MKKLASLVCLGVFALGVGCRAQVPPASNHVVNLTWTAPASTGTWSGCTTSNPCVYAVYRCSSGATICGDTSQSAWKEITTIATRPSGTAYTDSTAAGLTAYYVVETVQGSSNSGPSNTTVPLTVPGTPTAPLIGAPTTAENVGAPLPAATSKELAANEVAPLQVVAKLGR